jgi:hypothetical protein
MSVILCPPPCAVLFGVLLGVQSLGGTGPSQTYGDVPAGRGRSLVLRVHGSS